MRVAQPSWIGRQRYWRSWTAALAVMLVVGAVVLVVVAMVQVPRWLVTDDAASRGWRDRGRLALPSDFLSDAP